MKVLYIVSRPLEINTSASIRNRALIMGLLENNYEVNLVTSLPDKNHMAYDESMALDGIKVKYIKLNGIQSVARVGRIFKFLSPIKKMASSFLEVHNIYDNMKSIINHIKEVDISGYDVIISSSDPKSSHLFVDKLIQKYGYKGRWIQVWGDPFYGDITLSTKAKKIDILKEEKRLISLCDKVIYVSKLTLDAQKELYPNYAFKMKYIPIPYLHEVIHPINDFSLREKINIAYCGDYDSNVRNIRPLYDSVIELPNVNLTICGNSDLILKQKNNIQILGRQSYRVIEKIEAEADILVHISNLKGGQIPGKIYQYSGTNKPILFILDGDVENIKSQFEGFKRYNFSNNTKECISNILRSMIAENEEYFPVKEFSPQNVAIKIMNE